ncbi:PREDICTED: uncharacterized protein LOC104799859 [Tarenaya hassleriana]|uniref:uncharacterized protein LOC104799859 n=1 Tax=Tarenaya hassleriana TaxID=28532 RepID=UPI00053C1DEF|nr:PREDICTED: uncharacterized protein LOC104799859 [Tarenaya hassleriana]
MDQTENLTTSNPVQNAPIFNGEAYQIWAVRMRVFLEGADLWEAVEEEYEIPALPANPTVNQLRNNRERVTKKSKAKSCIFAAVTPSILIKIMNLVSAKAMWDFLKTEYEGDEKIRDMKVLNLWREFKRQMMKGDESVKDYVNRLVNIIDNIRILGTKVDDDKIVQKILVSVPEKFEATVASLENTKQLSQIKLTEVISALQAQEQRRLMRKGENVEGALKATVFQKTKNGNNSGKSGNSTTEGGGSEGFSDPCKHCNKKGHLYWRCWKRPDVKCRKCGRMGHVERICREKNVEDVEAQKAEANEVEELFKNKKVPSDD